MVGAAPAEQVLVLLLTDRGHDRDTRVELASGESDQHGGVAPAARAAPVAGRPGKLGAIGLVTLRCRPGESVMSGVRIDCGARQLREKRPGLRLGPHGLTTVSL